MVKGIAQMGLSKKIISTGLYFPEDLSNHTMLMLVIYKHKPRKVAVFL